MEGFVSHPVIFGIKKKLDVHSVMIVTLISRGLGVFRQTDCFYLLV